MREFVFLADLAERLAARRGDTRLGIGDDAAIIAPEAGAELAVTTDTLIAGHHFPADTPAFDIGTKALAVNLSDLGAMGAAPAWATIALTTPALEAGWIDAFLDGAQAAIGASALDIIGGDTTHGALSITVTAIGSLAAGQAITRAGAAPGDVICVTGTLGDAALGLRLWPERAARDDADSQYLISRLTRPAWRDGARLRGLAHAAIDISDGLAADLGHILAASGVGARVNVDALPASDALVRCLADASDRRRLQLTGGDDYELCVVLAPARMASAAAVFDCGLTRIGTIESQPGLRLVDRRGAEVDPTGAARGWDHFAGR